MRLVLGAVLALACSAEAPSAPPAVLEKRWPVLRKDLSPRVPPRAAAAPLLALYWERHLEEPLADIRARYRVRPLA
ncbi:MAG: hypothetical protein M5U28_18015 [Sandaracinaceae bacterium]|nr:hypothetical protein [Sandaracinaceae bacterium]